MNKLSFKLFGADLFFSLEEKFGPFKTDLRGGIKHSSTRKSVPDTKKKLFSSPVVLEQGRRPSLCAGFCVPRYGLGE